MQANGLPLEAGDAVLLSKTMETLSAPLGRVKVVLNPADTDIILAQPGSYSIVRTSGNYEQAVYVDANSQARADCNIVDSVLPQFIDSQICTVPDIYGQQQYLEAPPTSWPDWALNPQPLNWWQASEFYSSHIPSTGASMTTIVLHLVHYTGFIKVQGAENYESVWYNATEDRLFLDETGPVYFNVLGYHPLLRVAFNNQYGYGAQGTAVVNTEGVVTGISLTASGQNYIAPPYVQILGDGVGATAEATVANGSVSSVTVTNGGAGYWPIQLGSSQQAAVVFTNGRIDSIQYR